MLLSVYKRLLVVVLISILFITSAYSIETFFSWCMTKIHLTKNICGKSQVKCAGEGRPYVKQNPDCVNGARTHIWGLYSTHYTNKQICCNLVWRSSTNTSILNRRKKKESFTLKVNPFCIYECQRKR